MSSGLRGRVAPPETGEETRYMTQFDAMKVFSTTLQRDRDVMGERISQWLKDHPELTPVETQVTQTSDREYHCLTVTLFLRGDASKMLAAAPAPAHPRVVVPRPSGTARR